MRSLEILDRHLLIQLDGGLALVDTGSPFDIGRGGVTPLLDETWAPPTAHARVLDVAERHIGTRIDWLMGYPTLSRHHLLLDWTARAALLRRAPIEINGATRLPITLDRGVPRVEVLADEPVWAVLDSGAALSFVPRAATKGRPLRTERDFHPSIGAFETEVWTVPITIGGRAVTLEAGVLPPALERPLGALSGGWIVGSDFFRDRAIVLAYPEGAVYDAPGSATPAG
ncbi:hypothetical protein [Sorangium sp. So ce1000]|uniref:hypothetical protein n=1 Tax=Sorangium sp. So ce1000 TaxID=3133325 RepID=UPI003F61BFE4